MVVHFVRCRSQYTRRSLLGILYPDPGADNRNLLRIISMSVANSDLSRPRVVTCEFTRALRAKPGGGGSPVVNGWTVGATGLCPVSSPLRIGDDKSYFVASGPAEA